MKSPKEISPKLILTYSALFLMFVVAAAGFYYVTSKQIELITYLSSLSYISNFGLFIVTLFALESIFSSKNHSDKHFQRESSKSAIQNIGRFKSKVMGMKSSLVELINVESFDKTKIINFTQTEYKFDIEKHYLKKIEDLSKKIETLHDGDSADNKDRKNIDLEINQIKKEISIFNEIQNAVNELEIFSSAIVNRVADENISFQLCSKIFCEFVEKNYLHYCFSRKTKDSLEYKNTVTLYTKWSKELTEYSYTLEMNDISKKLEDLKKI